MFSVDVVTPQYLLVSWEAPYLRASDGNLEEYTLLCKTDTSDVPITIQVGSSETSRVNVSGLVPHTTYTCCVKAHTTVGVSADSCISISTSEDGIYHIHILNNLKLVLFLAVPESAPEQVSVVAVSPFAVEIEWSAPATPNGVITHYNIYTSNGVLVYTVDGSQGNYVYSGLSPYMNVSVSISANTTAGEGPRSPVVTVKTRESGLSVFIWTAAVPILSTIVPSIVQSLEVVKMSDESVTITWGPPLQPNGVLLDYHLTLMNLVTGNISLTTVSPNQTPAHINTFNSLGRCFI